jgi:hypothetical protein
VLITIGCSSGFLWLWLRIPSSTKCGYILPCWTFISLLRMTFFKELSCLWHGFFFTFNASENKALVTCITQMRWVVRFTQLRVRKLIQRHAVWYKDLKVSEESAASSVRVEDWQNILLSSWTDFSAKAPNRAIFCLSADSHCSLLDHTHLYSNVLGLHMNRIFHRNKKFYPFRQIKKKENV